MITRSEKEIRNVEQIIDKYYTNFKIFKIPKQLAVIYALKFFEDACRLPQLRKRRLLEDHDTGIHTNLDCLDIIVKWIYSTCKDNEFSSNDIFQTDGKLYRATTLTFYGARHYSAICAGYTSWSRGYLNAELDTKKKSLRFIIKDYEASCMHAEDTILYQSNKISVLDRVSRDLALIDPDLKLAYDDIIVNTKVINNRVSYKISPHAWNTFEYLANLQINDCFELPTDWSFSFFTLQELRKFWRVLLTKAIIHDWACMNSGADGIGLDSVIIIIGIKELCTEIEEKTGLPADKSLGIINFLTYNPAIKNTDIAWQPLILLDNCSLAIAPNLIINNNAERNIISLINKTEQATYSRLSSMKEDIMVSELAQFISERYPHLLLSYKILLPSNLPDIDFIIYDRYSKVLFIAELKWLLPVASAQESFAREIDISKGIKQATLIRDYVIQNAKDCIDRSFKCTDLIIEDIFICVISKHNTGSIVHNKNISVITEPVFRQLMDKYAGNMKDVVTDIKNKDYLPKVNDDFKILYNRFDYAGYKISTPGLQIFGNSKKSIGYDGLI